MFCNAFVQDQSGGVATPDARIGPITPPDSPSRAARHILAVTGLKREAKALAGPGVLTLVGGGDADGLRRRIEGAIASERPAGIISIGLGGALAPGLNVGDWVVARAVVAGAERFETDPSWTERLAERLPNASLGDIAGQDGMVIRRADKAALHAATGALAVDMESHVAARIAAAHGLPFASARVISDTTETDLPPAVLAGMKPDGGMNLFGVLGGLARDPRQLPPLIRTARDAGKAFRVLLGGHDFSPSAGV